MRSTDAALKAFPELQRLVDLRAGGWQFGHWYDNGELTKLVAWHAWPGGYADALRVRYASESAGMRCDADGGVVWQREGTLTEVVDGLLALPAPGAPGAPRLVRATVPKHWLP